MGNTASSLAKIGNNVRSSISRKRKRDDGEGDANNSNLENEEKSMSTPKRKRSKSTSKYIYQTLFLEGQGSDVTIIALGKEWHLHKVYLCQCEYFRGMFSGSWAESNLKAITLDIPDDTIDEKALKTTFGALYTDSVFIRPVDVTRVLAAANLFQLDDLIQQCVLIMREKISCLTVCSYYWAAHLYDQRAVKADCVAWLEQNLLTSQTPALLADISVKLMEFLVKSPKLFVVQVELNIYAMLKRWIFLRLDSTGCWKQTDSLRDLDKACHTFFREATVSQDSDQASSSLHFLTTSLGRRFVPVFQAVRWNHIICEVTSLKTLEHDRIIPLDWLQPIIHYQWLQMLQVDQGLDNGPNENFPKEEFDKLCVRCGRVLEKDGQYCWRWTGYSFGFDLIVSYVNRLISIKRNMNKADCVNMLCHRDHRNLMFRLNLTSLDELGRVKHRQTTGVKVLTLRPDQENVTLICDHLLTFPLQISLSLLMVSPLPDTPYPQLKLTQPSDADKDTSETTVISGSGVPLGSGVHSGSLEKVEVSEPAVVVCTGEPSFAESVSTEQPNVDVPSDRTQCLPSDEGTTSALSRSMTETASPPRPKVGVMMTRETQTSLAAEIGDWKLESALNTKTHATKMGTACRSLLNTFSDAPLSAQRMDTPVGESLSDDTRSTVTDTDIELLLT